MQSARMLAELLEEKVLEVERMLPEDRTLHQTMREAAERLRQGAEARALPLLSREALEALPGVLTRMDVPMYLEQRGNPRLECAIVYAMHNDMVSVRMASGERRVLDMAFYGRSWQVWEHYPSGGERTQGRLAEA